MGFFAGIIYFFITLFGIWVGHVNDSWSLDIWILLAPVYIAVFCISCVSWVQLIGFFINRYN